MKPGRAFLRGMIATGIALILIYASGALLGSIPYPPAVIAGYIVRGTPGDFATRMIEALGLWAQRSLFIGIHVGLLAMTGFVARAIDRPNDPRTPRSRARLALGISAAIFLGNLGLALVSPTGSSAMVLVVYAVAAFAFSRILGGVKLRSAFEPEVREGETPLDAMQRSRRRFLIRVLAAVGGLIIGGLATLRFFSSDIPVGVEIVEADLPFQHPPDDLDFPEVAGISSEITTNSDFYTIDINFVKPNVDHRSWSLKVGGLVSSPYELSYAELQEDFEVVELAHTLTCISNEVGGDLISTAIWRGVKLSDVLERAGMRPGVVDIVFRAAEGYTDSITLAKAMEDTTLVVFGMNGVALPREHGFPARIIVPGIYGMKNVKWLTEIEAVDHDYKGYWMVRGWSDEAIIKTQSRIDAPTHGQTVSAGSKVGGVAWAGDRQIMAVEISLDDGRNWKPAVLKRELSQLTWRLWAADIDGNRGRRKVLVRATDGSGSVQPEGQTRPHPAGADGRHSIEIEIA